MISTRTHGLVDYSVVSLIGSLTRARSLPPAVRRLLGRSSLGHATYAALTDYEGGLQPRLTMRQHLTLDALGGAGFCAAAILMRRQPIGARALLFGLGLGELAVVALSSATPLSGPGPPPPRPPPAPPRARARGRGGARGPRRSRTPPAIRRSTPPSRSRTTCSSSTACCRACSARCCRRA